MAKTTSRSSGRSSARSSAQSSGRRRKSPRSTTRNAASKQDAIALLKADHRQVETWFSQFEKTRSDDKKSDLAQKICTALKVHTRIEEELFYPAFFEATGEKELHHEAEIEHDGAKKLIAEIEGSGPDDDYYDAKVKVLSEMIKHHVKEEEQAGGMFAKARKSEMDLKTIGEQLQARKKELMNGAGSERPRRQQSERVSEQIGRM